MIDMHNHIMFGIDDGAKTFEESMELIKEATNKGVTDIIFTPHFNKRNYNQNRVLENFQSLKDSSEKVNLNINLYLGNEVYIANTYASILDNGFNTLADSNYILIEFNELMLPVSMPEICYEIKMAGCIPIIAHAERYGVLHSDAKLLKDILGEGAHLQVNATAILKKENKERNKFAHYLLKNELISFIASDVHNNSSRKFYLDEAYKTVCKISGTSYADKIFRQNQLNIINNKEFDSPKLNFKKTLIKKPFL